MINSVEFNGLPILRIEDSIQISISSRLENESPSSWHFSAGYTFVSADKDLNLKRVLRKGNVICDSLPVAKYLSFRGEKFSQLRGIDFLRYSIENDLPGNHFFLGGSQDTLNNLVNIVSELECQFSIVGISDSLISPNGYMTEIPFSAILESRATVVWVCLGSPKQDFVASHITEVLGVHTIALGAALDFYAGNLKEAPIFFRKLGLEWLFRFFLEPRRLWRRYLVGNFLLIQLMVRDYFSLRSTLKFQR